MSKLHQTARYWKAHAKSHAMHQDCWANFMLTRIVSDKEFTHLATSTILAVCKEVANG